MTCIRSILGLALFLAGLAPLFAGAEEKAKLNVLFIAVDDLRPELGCFGSSMIRSPNIDRLAARGLVFNRAYCQQALGNPSRASLLTGRRPDTTKVLDQLTHFRKILPDVVTLPEHFKKNGYHCQALCKVFHTGYDDPPSWSVPLWNPRKPAFGPDGQEQLKKLQAEAMKDPDPKKVKQVRGLPWEAADVPDNYLADGTTADQAIKVLRQVKAKPFFLAVGFLKPHVPFVAPKKYWDLYPEAQIKLPSNTGAPKGVPGYALSTWPELRAYHGIPKKGPVTEEQAHKLIQGYYACISYVDAQVGRVLDELDRLKLRDKTMVVLWSDHGFQLGEHGMWCKSTNYELSTRVPLIVAVPGQASAGRKTDAFVELVDVYPSLVEACALPLPDHLEGTSFRPLLEDPQRPWKKAAFSQYPRSSVKTGAGIGHAMRTQRYRLVEWWFPEKGLREYELYDHMTDPEENVNLAKRPDQAERVARLAEQLHAGWKLAQPPSR